MGDGGNSASPVPAMRWPTFEQKQVQFRRFGYEPSEIQAKAHQALVPSFALSQALLVLGGERAGKTTIAAYEAAALVPFTSLVFLAGDSYENTEPEFAVILSALRATGNLAGSSTPRRGQWQASADTGCEIRSVSFARDGADALIATGKAPDVVLLCEAGMLEFNHFLAAFGRVAEKRGLVLASGTLKDALPWYAEKYREFQGENPYNGKSVSIPSWGNPAVYPLGEDDPTIQQLKGAFDDQTFRERFGAEPVPSALLVFGRQFTHELHVKELDYLPSLPVEIAIDPGYAGAYAVQAMQWTGASEVRVFDEFYQQYATWHDAVSWLRAKPWGDKVTKGVGDHAIHQHHADRSQYEQWLAAGVTLRSKPVSIADGVDRMRSFLRSPFTGTPRIAIDPRCKGLIWELAAGERYARDQEGKPVKEKPIDRDNHARKAVSYWLIDHFGRADTTKRRKKPAQGDYWAPARRG